MSTGTTATTTTTETAPNSIRELLQAYEIHHSVDDESPSPQPGYSREPENHGTDSWLTTRRRVPQYRPTDRSHSWDERPANLVVNLVFLGIYLNSVGRSLF